MSQEIRQTELQEQDAAVAAGTAEAHQGGGARRGAPAAGLSGRHARVGAGRVLRVGRRVAASSSTTRTTTAFRMWARPGIEGVKVFVCQLCDGTDTIATETGPDGFYSVDVPEGTDYDSRS